MSLTMRRGGAGNKPQRVGARLPNRSTPADRAATRVPQILHPSRPYSHRSSPFRRSAPRPRLRCGAADRRLCSEQTRCAIRRLAAHGASCRSNYLSRRYVRSAAVGVSRNVAVRLDTIL